MRYNHDLSFHELIASILVPNEVTILGVTGQAGAGKSNHVSPLAMAEAGLLGFATAHLGLDAFFILSSRERKQWLAEGEAIGGDEAARRNDQTSWWDFSKAEQALETLSRGQALHLENVYNRADGGELTAEVHIDPTASNNGMLVVFDGVAIAHLGCMRKKMFVYADPDVRLERLKQRDRHRKGEEVKARFELTESFEREYFECHWHAIDLLVGNNVDNPRVLHHTDFDTVFSADCLLSAADDRCPVL